METEKCFLLSGGDLVRREDAVEETPTPISVNLFNGALRIRLKLCWDAVKTWIIFFLPVGKLNEELALFSKKKAHPPASLSCNLFVPHPIVEPSEL